MSTRASLRAGTGSERLLLPRWLLGAAGSGGLGAACGIGLLATSGWLISRASEHPPVFALSIAIGAVQAFALGRGIARYLQRLSVHGLALELLGTTRLHLFDALEPLVPGGIRGASSGDIVSGFVSDAEVVAEGFARRLIATIDITASVVIGTLVACVIEPTVGAVLMVGALLVLLTALIMGRSGRAGAIREAESRAELAGAVIETMRAAPELVAYGRADLVQGQLDDIRSRSVSAARRRALSTGFARGATVAVAGAVLAGVVASGLAANAGHRLSGVMLCALVFTALAVLDQCTVLPAVSADLDAARAGAGRIDRLARRPPAATEPDVDSSPPDGPVRVQLDNVAVVADDATLVAGASVDLAPGGRVALVGPSGSGKTTALYALLHFLECAHGRATVGGVDVSRMSRAGIARHLGWMADRTHVFATTLAENLRLARPSATPAECVDTLNRVGLSTWYDCLPLGLETMLGSGGRPMSAGERQRLGLARALLAGGSVLLLDEPTAHLDPSSSSRVLSELVGAAGTRSVLVVSHEPDIGAYVDDVVRLDGTTEPGTRSVPDPA